VIFWFVMLCTDVVFTRIPWSKPSLLTNLQILHQDIIKLQDLCTLFC